MTIFNAVSQAVSRDLRFRRTSGLRLISAIAFKIYGVGYDSKVGEILCIVRNFFVVMITKQREILVFIGFREKKTRRRNDKQKQWK